MSDLLVEWKLLSFKKTRDMWEYFVKLFVETGPGWELPNCKDYPVNILLPSEIVSALQKNFQRNDGEQREILEKVLRATFHYIMMKGMAVISKEKFKDFK
jgi:hypothetical protein